MQVDIKCPACNTDSSFYVMKNVFQGPFRCWKCKAMFTLKVKNDEIQSCEPLKPEDFEKLKVEKQARKKKAKEKTA